jgi:hypothetical protein
MADQYELLAKLDRWLAAQPRPATLAEVLQTGDGELLAAVVLKAFRAGARKAVTRRVEREELSGPSALHPPAGSAALRVFAGLARAWTLDQSEQLALLGVSSSADFAQLQKSPDGDLPISIIEKVVVLLEIFGAIGVLLPVSQRADAWMRSANRAPPFGGRSALELMLELDLAGMYAVRNYLRDELAGA